MSPYSIAVWGPACSNSAQFSRSFTAWTTTAAVSLKTWELRRSWVKQSLSVTLNHYCAPHLPQCTATIVLLFHMLLHTGQLIYHTHAPTSVLFPPSLSQHKHTLKILKPQVTKAKWFFKTDECDFTNIKLMARSLENCQQVCFCNQNITQVYSCEFYCNCLKDHKKTSN